MFDHTVERFNLLAESCRPAWGRSAHVSCGINSAMRIFGGCVTYTLLDILPVHDMMGVVLSQFNMFFEFCFLLVRVLGLMANSPIYIIKEKLETLFGMESYLPTSDRHAASWIFSDGPSKQLGVVKLRYNGLKLLFL